MGEAMSTRHHYSVADSLKIESLDVYQGILEKYELTDSLLAQNIIYYSSRPKLYEKIYEKVVERLNLEIEDQKQQKNMNVIVITSYSIHYTKLYESPNLYLAILPITCTPNFTLYFSEFCTSCGSIAMSLLDWATSLKFHPNNTQTTTTGNNAFFINMIFYMGSCTGTSKNGYLFDNFSG